MPFFLPSFGSGSALDDALGSAGAADITGGVVTDGSGAGITAVG